MLSLPRATRRAFAVVPAVLVLAVGVAGAQEAERAPPRQPSIVRPALFGVLGGSASWMAAALIMSQATPSTCSGGPCPHTGAILVPAVVGTLGLAGGIHLGNRRLGNLGADFFVGAGIWGAGALLATLTNPSTDGLIAIGVAIPIVQLAGVLAVERLNARARPR